MLLQLMVRPAFAIDVARASQAALVVRDAMVEIALFGGPTAWRVAAGSVPRGGPLRASPPGARVGAGAPPWAPPPAPPLFPRLLSPPRPPPLPPPPPPP